MRELARLFVYDPDACEHFIGKVIHSVDIDNSGTLNFSEFLMLMVKNEGLDGVRQAFQVNSRRLLVGKRSHGTFLELRYGRIR